MTSSEPSIITAGNGTLITASTTSPSSRIDVQNLKSKVENYRGMFFWKGKHGNITREIISLPWNIWWQSIIMISIVYKYIVNFLLGYYMHGCATCLVLEVTIRVCDLFYAIDVFIHLLHALWPAVRLHVRIYRRNYALLFLDIASIVPVNLIMRGIPGYDTIKKLGRLLSIARIYRIIFYCREINDSMHRYRTVLFVIEHVMGVLLGLHGASCVWYSQQNVSSDSRKHWYHELGYPVHVGADRLLFNSYTSCWYYCTCRLFNVIFGDSFPMTDIEKWLTVTLMLLGYVFIRYWFIGSLAWQSVIRNSRRLIFIDRYHHMIQYLKFRGAPENLVEQAKQYKLTLWKMKDGVMHSDHLQKLPLPLQMELIFDINVGLFHNTLLFQDTGEAFLRQISLLMRHELFLAGQDIWNQDVVKTGMICIKRGVVEMLSDEDDESPMIAFKEGTVLGELSLFYSIPSKVTVKAASYVEVQVLRRTDFMKAMSEQPVMLRSFRDKILKRLYNAIRRQNAIVAYDKDDSRLIRTRHRPMKVLKDRLAGVEDEDPTFVDDSHMYYKDENNIRQPKFTTDYLELYQLANNVTTVEAPRICLRSGFPWILEPDTDFTHIFDIIHFILVWYVCIMSPYVAILSNVHSDVEKVLSTIVVAGLLLNIYIQLTTAIVEKDVRKETVGEIAEEKMATFGFYLDILSVFPVYIFSDTLDPHGESAVGQVAHLFPIFQVWHIWDYMNKWEMNFNSNLKFLCLAKYFMVSVIFSYWSGCFLYLFACPRNLCREKSWMAQQIYKETKIFMTSNAKHEKPIVTSLSFGTAVFTGSGTADLAPGVEDLIVVSLIFILGVYLCSFYTAKICCIYMLTTQRKLKFKESMRELFYFLSVNHVSSKIKARVKKFFCVQWYYNYAVSSEELFNNLSTNIQQDVLLVEMVDTLLCCPLFQECCRDFLQTIAANTRVLVLPDNETVQHAADIGRDMYILQKGHCDLLNHYGKIVSCIGPGSDFGVIEMLFGLPKVYTVLTSTNCILLHIEYSALIQCWSTFPDISHPIVMTLVNDEVVERARKFEIAKPLTGRIDTKINRIAQEIKDSFVLLSTRQERYDYIKSFEGLGILKCIRYFIVPAAVTPHGLFLKCWCVLRFLMAVYYISTIPYNIATKRHTLDRTLNLMDIALYIDILIMAYVAYYNEKSVLVTHPLLTISRYLKRGFLVDAIIAFPFEQLLPLIINDSTNVDLLRVNKILQVWRITGTFSYWESDIMRVNEAAVLLKFLPLAVAIVNFFTAFIFINSCESYVSRHSYFTLANCSRALIINGKKTEIKTALNEYTATFFWVLELFIGCGCSPVIVSNKTDMWLTMVLQVTSFLYFAFMFGYVASTRSAASQALLDHTEKTRDLGNFLYQQNVEPILTAKTLRYFEYVWKRTNGSNPQQICRRLHSSLMEDTLVYMYEKTLREVPLFGKVERSFIRVITQHLHEMYFLKGDMVIQFRDIQPYIYIIYRGKVDVLTSYNEMITCMGPGGMFGNFTGQPISCSDVSIYASRSLDLLVIPSQTFFNLVKYYPKIQEPLNKAFEVSKDYILPISMDTTADDTASEDDTELDLISLGSGVGSRSSSNRFEMTGQLTSRSSQSNVSQAKSSMSTATYKSYLNFYNLYTPGTWLFQIFGYTCCFVAAANYVLILYELVTLNHCHIIFWLQALFDIFFYIKTYLSMHQTYINKHGDLIMDTAKCRKRYFSNKLRFWSDLFVNVSLEPFALCFTNYMLLIHYLRINKLFRLKYLVEFYKKTSAQLTNNITTLQAIMTLLVAVLLIHTFTCTWLLVLMSTSPISIIRTIKINVIEEETHQHLWDYVSSVYVVIAEMTGTGGDEFMVDYLLPLIILAICLICGKMLAAIVVATAMQVAYSTKHALSSYEKETGELIDVLNNQGLSRYQSKKFWKYIQQLWITERGRQLPALLAQTPYVRRCDLMSAMFGQYLRNCYIFAETGEQFLRQLTAVLDYTFFFPGNYIVVAGDSEARMYWVASGSVSVVSVRPDLTETTHELLGPGDEFGILQGLSRGLQHYFSYRAETKVSILTLSLESWSGIAQFFPEAQRIISEKSEVLFTQL